jgi:hypothetical protein
MIFFNFWISFAVLFPQLLCKVKDAQLRDVICNLADILRAGICKQDIYTVYVRVYTVWASIYTALGNNFIEFSINILGPNSWT